MDRLRDVIHSRSNPLLGRIRRLKQEAGRGAGLALVEGVKLLEDAASAGVEIVEAAVTPRALAGDRVRAVVDSIRGRNTVVRLVEETVLRPLSEVKTSPGLLAVVRRPAFDERRLYQAPALIVVAVGFQNPGNLGGLLRTAEAAGATGAYLTEGTADPFSWKALRGSMGSAFRLPHVTGLPGAEVIVRLRSRGIRIIAASADAECPYDAVDLRGPLALLFGNEGAGLPDELVRAADFTLAIPMAGRVESLNAGVAAGVVLFETARQRRGECRRPPDGARPS